jgi:hypothetical protein
VYNISLQNVFEFKGGFFMKKTEDYLEIQELNERFRGYFKKVSYNDDKRNVEVIVDKYGNVLTPFFSKVLDVIKLEDNSCLVLGKKKTKNQLYYLECDYKDPEKSVSEKIDSKVEIVSINKINRDVLLVTTKSGSFFVDTVFLEQLSDLYDSLYFDEESKKWVYEMKVSYGRDYTTISGPITLYGKVGSLAYDSLAEEFIPIKTKKSKSRNEFDKIITDDIANRINKRNNKKGKEEKKKLIKRFFSYK